MKLPAFLRHRSPVAIDVEPVHVTMVNALSRFGAMPIETLFLEASGTHGIDRVGFDGAVAKLVAQSLVDYRYDPGDAVTSVTLLPLGTKLAGRLPRETRSGMRFYL